MFKFRHLTNRTLEGLCRQIRHEFSPVVLFCRLAPPATVSSSPTTPTTLPDRFFSSSWWTATLWWFMHMHSVVILALIATRVKACRGVICCNCNSSEAFCIIASRKKMKKLKNWRKSLFSGVAKFSNSSFCNIWQKLQKCSSRVFFCSVCSWYASSTEVVRECRPCTEIFSGPSYKYETKYIQFGNLYTYYYLNYTTIYYYLPSPSNAYRCIKKKKKQNKNEWIELW